MKEEFEALALRGNTEIGLMMYESIERYYMSDSDYHEQFGGRNETKQDFVKRVFGGKVNTPRTIAVKIADESNRENRWCLRNNSTADKKTIDQHETLIRERYDIMYKHKL